MRSLILAFILGLLVIACRGKRGADPAPVETPVAEMPQVEAPCPPCVVEAPDVGAPHPDVPVGEVRKRPGGQREVLAPVKISQIPLKLVFQPFTQLYDSVE